MEWSVGHTLLPVDELRFILKFLNAECQALTEFGIQESCIIENYIFLFLGPLRFLHCDIIFMTSKYITNM